MYPEAQEPLKREKWARSLDAEVIRLPFRTLALSTVSLPLFSFLFCIYLSVRFNFEDATETHCAVTNFLPSISAAIGEFVPQRYIWRIAIALHAAPRFLVARMYSNFMLEILPNTSTYKKLITFAYYSNVLENVALLFLSFISSKENYPLHKVSFTCFMIFSELYMILSVALLKDFQNMLTHSYQRYAYRLKKKLMIANLFAFFTALYFFYRHNTYCEPGMYTVFAFFEYLIVLTNMGFHMCAYYDFYSFDFVVGEWKSSDC